MGYEFTLTENASSVMDQDAYGARFESLSERYAKADAQVAALDEVIQDRQYRRTRTELFFKTLRKQEIMDTEFSDEMWHALADHATVYGKEDVRFTFRNGIEVRG